MHNVLTAGLVLSALLVSAGARAQQQQQPPQQPPAAQPPARPALAMPEEMRRTMAAQQAAENALPNTPGSGPYPAVMEVDPTLPDHVVYRPRDLRALGGKKLGIVIWGNGGCTDDGASARLHLAELASHGYLVIASGKILSGPSRPADAPTPTFMTTTGADMIQALDWAIAESSRKGSNYAGRIDPRAVAFSGHSCGGILSIQIANDPRVKTLIIHNSGVFPNNPQRPTLITDKAWLQDRLHTPIIYIVGNETDVGHPVALDDFARIAKVPVFLGQLDVGHGGTFRQPNGGLAAKAAVAWLDWQLRGDRRAGAQFIGADCGLCRDSAWKVQRKGF
uniref:Uncharacterized protein n=1 Tax=uncultured bacterium 5H7 TaxID=1701327 RepID=A0A0N9HTZ4_9BACT|nr:hypothetical protein 5H7_053 [uncultured bacterium 5H7]